MSSYSEGQTHQLMEALETAGCSATEVTTLGQLGEGGFKKLRLFLQGKAQIVELVGKVKEKAKKVFKPFITLTTGLATKNSLVAEIIAKKNKNKVPDELSNVAKSMMDDRNYTVSQETNEVSFIILTVYEDLGLTTDAMTCVFMTDYFCSKWSAKNLDGFVIELCKSDDGPRIRKHWTNQPKNTVVRCAMQQLLDYQCVPPVPCVWELGCDSNGRRWLRGFRAKSGYHWDPGIEVVFRFRKIST